MKLKVQAYDSSNRTEQNPGYIMSRRLFLLPFFFLFLFSLNHEKGPEPEDASITVATPRMHHASRTSSPLPTFLPYQLENAKKLMKPSDNFFPPGLCCPSVQLRKTKTTVDETLISSGSNRNRRDERFVLAVDTPYRFRFMDPSTKS